MRVIMAGNGRRASKAAEPVLRQDGRLRGRELGDPGVLLGPDEQWNPQVLMYWDNLRRSPQAQRMGTDLDWDFAELMMVQLHNFLEKHRWEQASEIRQWMDQLAYTPKSRAQAKFDAPEADDLAASTGRPGNTVDMESYRRRRAGLGFG